MDFQVSAVLCPPIEATMRRHSFHGGWGCHTVTSTRSRSTFSLFSRTAAIAPDSEQIVANLSTVVQILQTHLHSHRLWIPRSTQCPPICRFWTVLDAVLPTRLSVLLRSRAVAISTTELPDISWPSRRSPSGPFWPLVLPSWALVLWWLSAHSCCTSRSNGVQFCARVSNWSHFHPQGPLHILALQLEILSHLSFTVVHARAPQKSAPHFRFHDAQEQFPLEPWWTQYGSRHFAEHLVD